MAGYAVIWLRLTKYSHLAKQSGYELSWLAKQLFGPYHLLYMYGIQDIALRMFVKRTKCLLSVIVIIMCRYFRLNEKSPRVLPLGMNSETIIAIGTRTRGEYTPKS